MRLYPLFKRIWIRVAGEENSIGIAEPETQALFQKANRFESKEGYKKYIEAAQVTEQDRTSKLSNTIVVNEQKKDQTNTDPLTMVVVIILCLIILYALSPNPYMSLQVINGTLSFSLGSNISSIVSNITSNITNIAANVSLV